MLRQKGASALKNAQTIKIRQQALADFSAYFIAAMENYAEAIRRIRPQKVRLGFSDYLAVLTPLDDKITPQMLSNLRNGALLPPSYARCVVFEQGLTAPDGTRCADADKMARLAMLPNFGELVERAHLKLGDVFDDYIREGFAVAESEEWVQSTAPIKAQIIDALERVWPDRDAGREEWYKAAMTIAHLFSSWKRFSVSDAVILPQPLRQAFLATA